jgi:hypothetical protein
MQHPTVRGFFDEPTNTVSYLVFDPVTKRAAVVDPVLDYEQSTGKASTNSADAILAAAAGRGLPSIGCSRPTPMPTICPGRLTSVKSGAKVGIGEHSRRRLPADIQRDRYLRRRQRSSIACCRWRDCHRRACVGPPYSRPHAGVHLLQDR